MDGSAIGSDTFLFVFFLRCVIRLDRSMAQDGSLEQAAAQRSAGH